MRVLVCGASGFAGEAVATELLRRGHTVRGFDVAPPPHSSHDGCCWRRGALTDHGAVAAAVAGMDAVVDAAKCGASSSAMPGRRPDQSHGYSVLDAGPWVTHLQGLWNILDAASHSPSCRRVVHVGSCQAVWPKGGAAVRRFTEDVRSPEGDIYGLTKRLQEELCQSYNQAHGLPIIVLRASSILDSFAGLSRNGALPADQAARLRQRHPDELFSSQSVCRWDLAAACSAACELPVGAEDFAVLHAVNECRVSLASCNVVRKVAVLGVRFRQVTVGDMLGLREVATPTAAVLAARL